MKICTKCKLNKNLNQFKKSKKGKNGLHSWCHDCNRQYRRDHYRKNTELRLTIGR